MLIAACPIPALALTQDELDASRNLWNMNGLNDYDYVLQRIAFASGSSADPAWCKSART